MATTTSRQSRGWGLFALPAVAFVLGVYVLSLGVLVIRSVTEPDGALGLGVYASVLTSSGFQNVLINTVVLAIVAAVLSVLIGYPIAYTIARSRGVLRGFLFICVLTPYLTSILIRTFAWQVVLGQQGLINSVLAALGLPKADLIYNAIATTIGLVHSQLPLVVLILVPVIQRVDASRMLAARSLGAGPAQAFFRVFLPATRPGIQVTFILALVYSAGSFAVPALLGGNSGRMLGSFIHGSIEEQANYSVAAAASVILGLVVFLILILFTVLSRQKIQNVVAPQIAAAPSASAAAGPGSADETQAIALAQAAGGRDEPTVRSSLGSRALGAFAQALDRSRLSYLRGVGTVVSIVLAVLVLIPQLLAIPISFSGARALVFPPQSWSTTWYANFFQPTWLDPTIISLRVGVITALAATALGMLAAIAVSRTASRTLRGGITPFLLIPLIFPAVVAAGAFFIAFLKVGLIDTQTGIVLAHISITLPQAFIITLAGMQTLDPDYERAAASLGAGRARTVRRILIPLLSGQILASLFLTFITSFDESTIAIFLSGVSVKTLPRRIYEALAVQTDPTVGVVAVLFMALVAVVGIGAAVVTRLRRRHIQGRNHT
ncbi:MULTISPECIES: ABC transporter permease subunit [Microbacterium]|uniref:ABC transporter permease subunit n=1 Tax=Microbacterium TaxID=33882 RepID=UPI00300F9DD7